MDTYVDDALEHLSSSMVKLPELPVSISIIMGFQSEFRFLRLFLLCFPRWDSDANLRVNLSFLVTSIADLCNKIERIDSNETFHEWHSVGAKVFHKIRECKAEIKKNYRGHLISCSLQAKPFTRRNERIQFLDSVLVNLNHLVNCQVDEEFLSVKSLTETLEERVFLLKNLVYFTAICGGKCGECFGCCEFNVLGCWANKAACLTLLHWLNEMKDDESVEKLHRLHIDFSPCSNPEFTRLCFQVIKVPKLNHSDTLIFGEFVSRFVDFFLVNVVALTIKDDVRMIREGLILLITFLADPLANDSELSLIPERIYAVLDQASLTICCFGEINMDLTKGKTTLDNLQRSIDEVRVEMEKKLYVHVPHSSWSNFPRTNRLGYYESVIVYLENLKETMNKNKKLVPFLKDPIFRIQEELLSLKPFLLGISTMQNEHKDSIDLWEQIINLSYQADLAIKSSFFIDHPIWYNMICLSFIVEEIKDIRFKVRKIEGSQICKREAIPPSMCSVDVVKTPDSTSIREVVVGFKQEIEVLTDRLLWGTPRLDIVSIVGMGGIGKTTLAMKLFNEPSIIQHFHKRAFCSFSQAYIKRNVLLDILKILCQKSDYEVCQMSDDDLAHMLYKSLKGFKYLIVMDDIWDISAWHDLRASFPDDNNGSRITFTTRINNISLLAKPDSTPYLLPFLSIDESWELLQRNIFHKDPCPPHLCEVGKLIAGKCRGLPLAIVVIAGLLAKTERNLLQWNEVADNLSTIASSEGCNDIIKLSYKNLPDALKCCFLYLGALCEGEILKANRLTLLWIAEGFVLKSGSSCLRKVAKKYMNDLGDRNLVTVIQRSCNGGIKSFRVHDLIRDFCRTEAQEEHYLCFINTRDNNNLPMPSTCGQYRFCIEAEWRSFVDAKPEGPTVHSLLYFSKSYREESCLQSLLHNFKLVQVLDLPEVEIVGEFPTAVTTLVHLTYLALRFFSAPYVPPEISNLWNLEAFLLLGGPAFGRTDPILWVTLILREPHTHHIDPIFSDGIWKLKRLRHVETEFGGAHVALDDVTGVSSQSQLHDLETFTSLYIPPGKDGDELLRRLPNVRKLSCNFRGWWDPHRKCYQLPKLESLTKLESLKMAHIGDEVCHSEMFSFPLTIRKLTLRDFKLPWNEFSSIIGKLPCLEVLVLYKNAFSGKIWDVEDEEFLNIKSLVLVDLDVEEWKASTDSFPSLEKLIVCRCRGLIEIPPCFGEVSTLKSISVKFSEKRVVDSAMQIQNDQSDTGNQSLEVELVLNSQ